MKGRVAFTQHFAPSVLAAIAKIEEVEACLRRLTEEIARLQQYHADLTEAYNEKKEKSNG